MAIAPTVQRYLEARGVSFDLVPHPRTFDAMSTAAVAHVPGDDLAKSVVLHSEDGYVVAVLPSTHRLRFDALEAATRRRLALATEDEITGLFGDCARGAVPALAAAYGLTTVVDDTIVLREDVYFEAGDHVELVHVDGKAFRSLLADATHGRISRHV